METRGLNKSSIRMDSTWMLAAKSLEPPGDPKANACVLRGRRAAIIMPCSIKRAKPGASSSSLLGSLLETTMRERKVLNPTTEWVDDLTVLEQYCKNIVVRV